MGIQSSDGVENIWEKEKLLVFKSCLLLRRQNKYLRSKQLNKQSCLILYKCQIRMLYCTLLLSRHISNKNVTCICYYTLQKHVRKVARGFGKKSCVSTGVRKSGNTYASPTAMI